MKRWHDGYCDVEGCLNRADYTAHMSPFKEPKRICEEHWIAMMRDAKQLVFREDLFREEKQGIVRGKPMKPLNYCRNLRWVEDQDADYYICALGQESSSDWCDDIEGDKSECEHFDPVSY